MNESGELSSENGDVTKLDSYVQALSQEVQ